MKALDPSTPPKRLADAILRVALAGIERALRRVTVERGQPLGDLALVPFGGGGGLLACDLAELLELDRVLIPRAPGLLCALGMLHTPASRDLSRTLLLRESDDAFEMAKAAADELAERATDELKSCGLTGRFKTIASLDVRYVGQSYELNVPLRKTWKRAFIKAHEGQFFYHRGDAPAEIVNVRVRVEATSKAPEIPVNLPARRSRQTGKAPGGEPIYAREGLPSGASLKGPAVVTELSSTLYLKQGWRLKVTEQGQLSLQRTGARSARLRSNGRAESHGDSSEG